MVGWRACQVRTAGLGVLCVVALGVLAACGSGGGTSSGSTSSGGGTTGSGACKSGLEQINGVSTRSFCGSATAHATAGGQSLSWSNGACYADGTHAGVNIGRVILGSGDGAKALKQQYDYFGVTVEAKADGTYTGIVSADYHGQAYALSQASVTFSGNLTQATFSGKVVGQNVTLSGSWTC
jgi:hypothetical protein